MLAQSLIEQNLRHFIMTQPRGIDSEVRRGIVKRAAHAEEIVKRLSRVDGLQQGPFYAARRSLEQHVGTRVQPGHDADLLQGLPIGCAKDELRLQWKE